MSFYFIKMKIIACITLCAITSAHNINQLEVPLYADPRRAVELSCHFQMDEQKLHSVKWYHDFHEIFRYNPQHEPPIHLYNISEVMVQGGECYPDSCMVRVMLQTKFTKAAYTCEVSTEGPKFEIARDTKNMTVVAMPEKDPVINGAQKVLQPGEQIFLNCTSDFSLPSSVINWYIDGELQKPEAIPPESVSQTGLRRSWRGLRLEVPNTRSGTIHVRCESTFFVDEPVIRATETIITIHSVTQLSKYVSNNNGIKPSKTVCILVLNILVIYFKTTRFDSL